MESARRLAEDYRPLKLRKSLSIPLRKSGSSPQLFRKNSENPKVQKSRSTQFWSFQDYRSLKLKKSKSTPQLRNSLVPKLQNSRITQFRSFEDYRTINIQKSKSLPLRNPGLTPQIQNTTNTFPLYSVVPSVARSIHNK